MNKSNEQLTLDIDWARDAESVLPRAGEPDDDLEMAARTDPRALISGSMPMGPRVGYDSSLPTERAPEAMTLARIEPAESSLVWDDESPTSVVIDRALLPRPPRAPRL